MNRRDALQRVAIMMGGAISAPSLVAMLEGCKSAESGSSASFSLSTDYQNLVAEIAEIIIPKTDTPGAKEAGVGPFIELMIKDCYSAEQGQHFIKGLDTIEEKAKAAGGNFVSLAAEKQTAILKEMEADAKKESEEAKAKQIDPETGKEKEDAKKSEKLTPFFQLMKELTLFGYFTSEPGATQALDYVPIPGAYNGCIPLKEGQKAYALS